MGKVKILVVEDEIIIADDICYLLEELGYEALEPAVSYSEAIEAIEIGKPDLAILDIQLSGNKTGIDVAKKIEEEYGIPFIFLTSNTDEATINEAKRVMPSAYLVKPFSKEDLYSSIEVALYTFAQNTGERLKEEIVVQDVLFVKEKGVFHKLIIDDIRYIKSAHVYLEIILKTKKRIVVRGSLHVIIGKLPEHFLRVHRGFVVNTKYLNQIDTTSVRIEDEVIPIGKSYSSDLLRKINWI